MLIAHCLDNCTFGVYFNTMLAYFLLSLAIRHCPKSLLRLWSWWSTGTVERISRRTRTPACCRPAPFTSPMSTPCTGGSMTRSLWRKWSAAKPSAATASQMATSGVPWTTRLPALLIIDSSYSVLWYTYMVRIFSLACSEIIYSLQLF